MWSSIFFGVFLIALSVCLLVSHAKSWRTLREEEDNERAIDFYGRQFRRRMQASGMLGIVGVAMIVGIWIDAQNDTILSVIFWCVVLLIVAWIGVLAVADWISSRFYFEQVRADQETEHAALKAELDRIRSREGNGRSD